MRFYRETRLTIVHFRVESTEFRPNEMKPDVTVCGVVEAIKVTYL